MNPNVKFGFGVAISGQRNNDYVPELVALSTKGGFRITPQVSKKLGVASGDYVMFINNFDEIEAAVRAHAEVIVKFCEANGLDIDSPEAIEAAKNEFGMWAIAKGIQCFDSVSPLFVRTLMKLSLLLWRMKSFVTLLPLTVLTLRLR